MVISCLLIILFFFSGVMCGGGKFCSKESSRVIDLDRICTHQMRSSGINKGLHEVLLLNKMHHQVYGEGYRCKASKSTMTCSKSYFWQINGCPLSDWKPIALSTENCWHMVQSKRCRLESKEATFDRKLNCDNTGACSVAYIPDEEYSWGTTS